MTNKKGIGLVEVLVGATIVGIATIAVLGVVQSSTKQAGVTKQLSQLKTEHDAMRALIASFPAVKAGSLICGRPHPYFIYRAETEKCVVGTGPSGPLPAPTTADLDTWKDLSKAVFEWSEAEKMQDGHPSPGLSANYFSTQVAPRLNSAGCIACHNGDFADTPAIMKRDFRVLSELEASPPVVGRAMISSPLGQTLITPTVLLPPLFLDSKGISHTLSFFNAARCAKPTEVTRTFTVATQAEAACPGLCNLGEYPDPERCNFSCSKFDKPASSTTPASCLEWKREVVCFSPTVKCSTPPTCPSPEVLLANSCQENQGSLDCGAGATTWHCVDSSKPLTGQQGIITFSLLSTAQPMNPNENIRRMNSEGTLP